MSAARPLGSRWVDVTPTPPDRHRCRECAAHALAWASLAVIALVAAVAGLIFAVRSSAGDWSTLGMWAIPVLSGLTLAVLGAIQAGRLERESWHRCGGLSSSSTTRSHNDERHHTMKLKSPRPLRSPDPKPLPQPRRRSKSAYRNQGGGRVSKGTSALGDAKHTQRTWRRTDAESGKVYADSPPYRARYAVAWHTTKRLPWVIRRENRAAAKRARASRKANR